MITVISSFDGIGSGGAGSPCATASSTVKLVASSMAARAFFRIASLAARSSGVGFSIESTSSSVIASGPLTGGAGSFLARGLRVFSSFFSTGVETGGWGETTAVTTSVFGAGTSSSVGLGVSVGIAGVWFTFGTTGGAGTTTTAGAAISAWGFSSSASLISSER